MQVEPKVKHSYGSSHLTKAACAVTHDFFSLQMINLHYLDTGLFGFAIAARSTEIDKIFKAVLSKMRDIAKNITEQDLTTAK